LPNSLTLKITRHDLKKFILILEEATSFISDESRKIALEWKNKVIAALFQFYRSIGHKSAAERFGNVILLISGIVSAGKGNFLKIFKKNFFISLSNIRILSNYAFI